MDPLLQEKLSASGAMFVTLFSELAVLFLLISFAVALINQKLPAERIQAILGGRRGRGYLAAAGLGAVTPFCSCSTIPMLIGLLKARAGFGPTMTFLFTSPLLNPIVIVLFIPVLGVQITTFYAVFALLTSIAAGVLLQRGGFERYIKQDLLQSPAEANSGCAGETAKDADSSSATCGSAASQGESDCQPAARDASSCCDTSAPARSLSAAAVTPEAAADAAAPSGLDWRAAWRESTALFRQMFPYMLVAMIIGAGVHGFVPADFFAEVANADNPAAVPAAAVIGTPLYMRVTTLLPLVGSFIAKGVSIGAIIALVIGSGGASLPELVMLKRLFRWQLLAAFLGVVFSVAVLGGYSVNALWG